MKAYKTEFRPTKQQIKLIKQTCGNTRFVYNELIKRNIERLDNHEPIISGMDFSKMINNDPNRPEWLTVSPSKALKQAIMQADKATRNYLSGKTGKPRFKKKNSVKNNRYYISCLSHEIIDERIPTSDKGIGIDFGLKDQFITKDKIFPSINKSPKVRKVEKELRRAQRSLSRKYESNMTNKVYYKSGKKKGQLKSFDWIRELRQCKNLQKQQLIVNKLHERLSRIRTEYNRACLNELLKQEPRFISIEDLNIKGLIKNRHLSKAIGQAQWYQSRQFLQKQCEKRGIELRLVPRFYPSSKLCSNCGYKNTQLKLKDRYWTCPACHTHHNRDINAAINIEQCQDYTVLTTV